MKPLALTMGDPAGIGGELTERAWLALHDTGPSFVTLDDPARFTVPIAEVTSPDAARGVFAEALPVIPVRLPAQPKAGHPDKANAGAVINSIERAAAFCLSGAASGMVTNPINKAALYDTGFAYPGHTEFLAALTGATGRQIMMLASPDLRVVPVTVHASLRNSIAQLSTEAIVAAAQTTAQALQREFGIATPRLAIAGLNPHAGEQGALGDEESTIIGPAITALRECGIEVSGPWSPDTMFTASARRRYDAAICMYHDQALIPLKTLDMDRGVNVTLGLPIVRTSPDHGTAYDIAGKSVANPASLIAAIRLAAELGRRRANA
jgi:4-hydroxythreonine-4-phosphate dehydrogenase